MTIRVRPTTRADLSAVDLLLARSYPRPLKPDSPPSVLVTALPLISRAQPHLVASGTYYCAEEEGRILGVGGWSRDPRLPSRAHVRHVATDPTATRRGIGRAILSRILAEARSAGLEELECWSTRTAVPFYSAVGFRVEGPMEVPLQPGITFPAIRMRLDLARSSPGR